MSSRITRASRPTEDEINDLVWKLQRSLLSISSSSCPRVSASKILEETCDYIKRLHREVDDLSEKLSQLLASKDSSGIDADTIRNLLQL